MGQNNDPTEHGDRQGQQGGQVRIPASERKRQSGYAPDETPQTDQPHDDERGIRERQACMSMM